MPSRSDDAEPSGTERMHQVSTSAALSILIAIAISCAGADTAWSAESWKPADTAPLLTRWAQDITPSTVLPEYPRPQCERDAWLTLNGLWQFSIGAARPAAPSAYPRQILVPFSPEAALSGVGIAAEMKGTAREYWYRRTFSLPAQWRDRSILLHFGAVSWLAEVFINGKAAGLHTGGFDPFTIDITPLLAVAGEQTIEVRVVDQVSGRFGGQIAKPVGKQRPHGSGIFYTASSGIWQTVWLEPVAAAHITALRMTPDVDAQALIVEVDGSVGASATVTVKDREGLAAIMVARIQTGVATPIAFPAGTLRLWSPDDPYLYRLEIALIHDGTVSDQVRSYAGMRKIHVGLGRDERSQRIFLNNQEIFQVGPLDQGYWPDGIYTAPSDEALRSDLERIKSFGMNMVRKHIKVEPERFYYHCDRLGLLVWQDMPCLDGDFAEAKQTMAEKANFTDELTRMVRGLHNHPSIITWVVFNEGWGQADTLRNVQTVLALDGSRLVDPASGWIDADIGHLKDNHAYPGPSYTQVAKRASVCGEFGGIGLALKGHLWKGDANPYQSARDGAELTARLGGLLEVVRNGWYGGLNAAVYTQITDVEEEVNGLITYDRSVVKPDAAALRAKILAVIAMPHTADYAHGGTTIRVILTPEQASTLTVMRIAGAYNGWAAPQLMMAKGKGVFEYLIYNPQLTGAVPYRLYPGPGADWSGAEGPDAFHRVFDAQAREVVLQDIVWGKAK
jgi:hypothetical protein